MTKSYRRAVRGIPGRKPNPDRHGRGRWRGPIDSDQDAVEVWTFDEEGAAQERFTGSMPVRLRGDVLGEIDLDQVFRRGV